MVNYSTLILKKRYQGVKNKEITKKKIRQTEDRM